jgi:hypothetical protein
VCLAEEATTGRQRKGRGAAPHSGREAKPSPCSDTQGRRATDAGGARRAKTKHCRVGCLCVVITARPSLLCRFRLSGAPALCGACHVPPRRELEYRRSLRTLRSHAFVSGMLQCRCCSLRCRHHCPSSLLPLLRPPLSCGASLAGRNGERSQGTLTQDTEAEVPTSDAEGISRHCWTASYNRQAPVQDRRLAVIRSLCLCVPVCSTMVLSSAARRARRRN